MTAERIISVGDLSSSLQHFSWPDYLVFLVMLILCSLIGIYFGFVENRKKRKNGRNVEKRRGSEALDYLVGGRKMQVFPVAMSLVASFVSGISLLGTATEVYVYGASYMFILLTIMGSSVIIWHVFLPMFVGLQLTSTYEYLELRFDKRLRLFGSILFTIGTIMWLPIVIYVPALAFNQVTGINIHIVTPIVCVVCIFYTCVGGLKAVVWTDVIQTVIMFGSIFLVIIKGTSDVGGFGVVWSRNADSGRIELPDLSPEFTVRYSVWTLFIGGAMHWIPNGFLNQVMLQRYLSLPSIQSARWALVIFTIGIVLLLGCCMYTGLLIFATYYNCDPLTTKLAKARDQLMPLLVMDILGVFPGLPGLFVAGVFSAALSSLSTGLNSLAAIILEDFCKPYVRRPLTDRQVAFIMRLVVVAAGALCVGLVFVVEKLGAVLQLSATVSAVTCGPMYAIFILGCLVPWFNGKSVLTGGVFGLIIMGYIAFKAQFAMMDGELRYKEKAVTTEGCTYSFPNSTSPTQSSWDEYLEHYEKQFYHMAYLWYSCFGCIITCIVAGIASFVFGINDARDLDPSLLSPIIRRFIKPRKYLSVQPDVKERESVIHAFEFKPKS